uniref:Uncharacterized protein n=1 Tax=Chromera velia CCMP2878 TaxID=1169474 RepID=A0A0G4HSI5_9ALVE|eukprot:Cvel_8274.t1-p1 / transcript=Cvel_8274.t1 / gene=Cvel_8274 / organism=Chromera_velia_CCMP2878 / gene_product=hypothetical protein / transcript_product=hypothetical protein / location=Cvel_scaffold453:77245-83570(+) / protein_length=402 / sequence_SO=supercontig / SO=protein_coding / is_pseudo=false
MMQTPSRAARDLWNMVSPAFYSYMALAVILMATIYGIAYGLIFFGLAMGIIGHYNAAVGRWNGFIGNNDWQWSKTVSTSYLDEYGYVCEACDKTMRHIPRELNPNGLDDSYWKSQGDIGNLGNPGYNRKFELFGPMGRMQNLMNPRGLKHESYTGEKVFNNPRMVAGVSKRVQCFHGQWTDMRLDCTKTVSRTSDVTGNSVFYLLGMAFDRPGSNKFTDGSRHKQGSGSVLCTSAYRHGHMSEVRWAQDTFFGGFLVSPVVIQGYHTWAMPLIWLMAYSRLLSEAVAGIGVLYWAEYMGTVVEGSEKFRRGLQEWLGEGERDKEGGSESVSLDEGTVEADGGLTMSAEELAEPPSRLRVFLGGCLFWSLTGPTYFLGLVRGTFEGVVLQLGGEWLGGGKPPR